MPKYVLADIINNEIYGIGNDIPTTIEYTRRHKMKDTDRYVYSNDIHEARKNNALSLTHCSKILSDYLDTHQINDLTGYHLIADGRFTTSIKKNT